MNKKRRQQQWEEFRRDLEETINKFSQADAKSVNFLVPSDRNEFKKSLFYWFYWTNRNAEVSPKNFSKVVRLARYWIDLSSVKNMGTPPRPPFNAEYVLYLLLRKEERDVVIGDLVECYGKIAHRFSRRRADIWFYKQVVGSLFPLLRRALLKIGAFVWLGRVLRRLIS